MNWKGILAGVALLGICLGAVFLIDRAFGQSLIGGQPSRWMTQEQIEACSEIFMTRKTEEPEKITCGDLRQLLAAECDGKKPETEVENPFRDADE